jgi:hypothetical protein
MVSDAELEKALRWVIRGLTAAEIDPNNIQAVVTWMIENPMPEKEVWLAETEEKDEQDKQAHIASLKEELAKLEGENKGGIIHV